MDGFSNVHIDKCNVCLYSGYKIVVVSFHAAHLLAIVIKITTFRLNMTEV